MYTSPHWKRGAIRHPSSISAFKYFPHIDKFGFCVVSNKALKWNQPLYRDIFTNCLQFFHHLPSCICLTWCCFLVQSGHCFAPQIPVNGQRLQRVGTRPKMKYSVQDPRWNLGSVNPCPCTHLFSSSTWECRSSCNQHLQLRKAIVTWFCSPNLHRLPFCRDD